MNWDQAGFKVEKVIEETCSFAGPNWNIEKIKRFVLKVKETNQIIEASYYIHFNSNEGKLINVGFEPSGSYGCPIGCLFCASGALRPIQPLDGRQIANQVLLLIDDCRRTHKEIESIPKYIFYVGIGEPTLINQLITASNLICKKYPGLSFKISTMAAVPRAIIQFAKSNLPLRSIQLSLPHWDEKKLKYLFANDAEYNLTSVLKAIKKFSILRPQTKIKINYIGIKGYNDTFEDIRKTINLVRQYLKKKFELKISCLNPTEISRKNALSSMTPRELESFAKFAQSLGVADVYLFGPMMNPEKKIGCGQLAGDYNCKT